MRRSISTVILLAAVACCVAADGPIKAANSAATVDLDPTSSRDLLILGIRTHEAKKAATQQVKANANPGTAKGDKAAAKAVTAQNRAGTTVPGVTGMSGRHLLEEENAPTRDLLILGYRTHEAKKAAAAQVKANANPGTAKGEKAAANALKYQNRAGVVVPGVTGMSGRHLLEEESEAANRNLLILGYKTHEAKKAAKYAVKEQSHANKAGLASTTAVGGRRLLEDQEAMILGYKTHEAKKAAKYAVKEQSHANKAGLASTTAVGGRRLLEEQDAAARNLLILGYKTHEAKKAAKYAVKEQSHANKAGLASTTAVGGRRLLEDQEAMILGYKTHEAKKAAKYAVKEQSHANKAGLMPTTAAAGRRLLEEQEAAARNLLILGYKTHEAKKAAKYAVKEQSHANKAGLASTTAVGGRHLLEDNEAAARNLLILGYRTHEAKRAAADQVKANANPGTAKGEKAAAKALSHQAKAGVAVPGVTGTSGRHLLDEENEAANRNLLILGYKTHEAKKSAKDAVKQQSHASKAGLAPTGRRLLEEDQAAARNLLILGYRTHEAKKAASEQVKANANPGTAKGDKAAAKAVTAQNKAGVAVPGVTGTSGRHL